MTNNRRKDVSIGVSYKVAKGQVAGCTSRFAKFDFGEYRPIFELQLPKDRHVDKTATILNHLAEECISGEWWLLNIELRILDGKLVGLQSGNGKRIAGGENVRLKPKLAYEDVHLMRNKKSRKRGSHL